MSCSGIMVSKDFFVTLIIPLTDGWVDFHLAVIPDQASLGHLHAKLYSICLVNSVRVLMIHEIVQGKYGNERLLTDSRFVYGHFIADLSLGEAVVLAEFPETLSLRPLIESLLWWVWVESGRYGTHPVIELRVAPFEETWILKFQSSCASVEIFH